MIVDFLRIVITKCKDVTEMKAEKDGWIVWWSYQGIILMLLALDDCEFTSRRLVQFGQDTCGDSNERMKLFSQIEEGIISSYLDILLFLVVPNIDYSNVVNSIIIERLAIIV